jgi:putative nucleotidyltransferase with HDIG domain
MSGMEISGLSHRSRMSPSQLVADIPAMPVVAMRAMRELGDENTTAARVSNIISVDQSMTSRILRLANSPVIGPKRKITTVSDALVLIGFSAMKGLIIAVSTRGVYKQTGLLEQLLWEHSVGCAVASSAVARAVGGYPPDEAYVAGLMHDIGRAVFANAYRQDYELLFQHIYNNDLPRRMLIDLEQEHFGLSHTDMGKEVVKKWNLSPGLGEAVALHHAQSVDVLENLEDPRLTAIVQVADTMCLHLGLGMRKADTSVALYNSPFAEFLGISTDNLAEILEGVLESFDSEKANFQF